MGPPTRGAEIYATNQGLSIEAPNPKYDFYSPWQYLPMTRRGSSAPPPPPNHSAPDKPSSPRRGGGNTPKDWRGEDPNLELEKSRYAEPIASRELLLKHLADAPEPLSAARLAKRLGLNTDAQRDALSKRLAAMVRDGQAIEGPNGFATAGDGERVAGRLR